MPPTRDIDITETPVDLETLTPPPFGPTIAGVGGERFRMTNLSARFRRVVVRIQPGADPAPDASARGRVARPGETIEFDTGNGNKIWAWTLEGPSAACILEAVIR